MLLCAEVSHPPSCINSYVDLLLGEFKHYKTRLAHGGIQKEVTFFTSIINIVRKLVCYVSV